MIRSILSGLVISSLMALLLSPSGFAEDAVCDDGFHVVEHALGETCVPDNPQRIIPLDMTITELLLIVDNPPVAASQTVLDAYIRMHPELEPVFDELMTGIDDTGFPPNIETVLNAEPDLIIGPRDFFTESLYPQLSEIAPTVLYEPAPGAWQERLIFAGEVLGLSDTVDDLLSTYEQRVEELDTQLGDDASDIEISLVRVFPGQIGLLLPGTAAASLLNDVELARPESQSMDYAYVLDELNGRPELLISQEELLLANGDFVFVFGDTSELADMALWQALPAVQDDRTYEVGYYWWGDSLISAHDMLDDLFIYVAGVRPETLNPFEEEVRPSDPEDEQRDTDGP